MPQIDRSTMVHHHISALLTVSYSRTVPTYSRGEVELALFIKK